MIIAIALTLKGFDRVGLQAGLAEMETKSTPIITHPEHSMV